MANCIVTNSLPCLEMRMSENFSFGLISLLAASFGNAINKDQINVFLEAVICTFTWER